MFPVSAARRASKQGNRKLSHTDVTVIISITDQAVCLFLLQKLKFFCVFVSRPWHLLPYVDIVGLGIGFQVGLFV
jgi:hypothetical protein